MNKLFKILPVIIVISALGLAIASVWDDSPIVDEIPHIGSGYSYVIKGDMRLNPEHPPLAKDLAGFAMSFLDLKQTVFETQYWQTDINGQWNFGRNLLFNSGNDAIKAAHAAKLPELLFFVFSGILIFVWTKKLYGRKAATLALFLFPFSPTVIDHSRYVTTDVPACFGILLATFFFVRYLENSSVKNLIIAGLALGIGELTKYSVFLLIPLFPALAVVYALVNSTKSKIFNSFLAIRNTAFVIAIAYIFVVWPVYGLHTMNYPPERQLSDTTYNLGSYGNRLIADKVVWASDKPFIRPLAQYGLGLLMVAQRSIGGNDTYFLGEVSKNAWKKYFPIVYFLKEPLAFWFLVIAIWLYWSVKWQPAKISIKHLFRKCGDWIKEHFHEFAMLSWLALYWYSSIKANLNIGVRHLMPTYGFVYILVAGQVTTMAQNLKFKKHNNKMGAKSLFFTFHFSLFTLLGWYLYENISVYPYYLTYFNQVALLRPSWATDGQAGYISGGHNYVVDSNVDWGQDAKRLGDWLDKNNVSKIYLDYFGWADADYYINAEYVWLNAGRFKSARDFLRENPQGGYIAVSASFFMGSRGNPVNNYIWLDDYKPVAYIGNSIFVWHIEPTK